MFLRNYPAMVVKDSLIVADLHLGITKELYEKGIMIPQQSKTLSERINELKKKTKTNRLILLGDAKHKIPVISRQEYREVPEFFKKIDYNKVVITKGNHDGELETLLDSTEKNIKIRDFVSIGDYTFTHGHIKIKTNKKNIVIGHNHPKIIFKDSVGAIYFEQVWVRGEAIYEGKKRNIIIVPTFNELTGSMVINDNKLSDRDHTNFMGPIAKNMRNRRVYLLDGTDIGFLEDLIKKR